MMDELNKAKEVVDLAKDRVAILQSKLDIADAARYEVKTVLA